MTEGVFLYFIPDKKFENVTREDLASNPILVKPFFDLIHSPKTMREKLCKANVYRGPENKSGCVISVQPQVATNQFLGYNPEIQTWQKFGEQWVGYQADMRPGPESLRRPKLYSGEEVELADDRIWVAPTLMSFDEKQEKWVSLLPATFGVDAELKHTCKTDPKHEDDFAAVQRIRNAVFGGESLSRIDAFELAVTVLSLNYRLGAVEASILELFHDTLTVAVLHAAVDATSLPAA